MNEFNFAQWVYNALLEDTGIEGDITSKAIFKYSKIGKATLHIKEETILAGVDVAQKIVQIVSPRAHFTKLINDGCLTKPGDIGFIIEDDISTILIMERLILNTMQRMSGIATLTKKYTDKLVGTNTQLLDTRKTTPQFRYFEKLAVTIGGGMNHRFGLYDQILIKDNHIDYAGGITPALDNLSAYLNSNKTKILVEVEARTMEDVMEVVNYKKCSINRIMLDNFPIDLIKKTLQLIPRHIETELSGGINLNNISDYAHLGANFISVGSIIHQARSVDLSLKAVF
ncbi:MAG: carboxylating nicotinate-nucleotide diphosphorylase [Phycisphaerales bacterium]|nr:carboxylating nicotinate-nucleotide diphosphorylase [Phycisphaerales bacterium]